MHRQSSPVPGSTGDASAPSSGSWTSTSSTTAHCPLPSTTEASSGDAGGASVTAVAAPLFSSQASTSTSSAACHPPSSINVTSSGMMAAATTSCCCSTGPVPTSSMATPGPQSQPLICTYSFEVPAFTQDKRERNGPEHKFYTTVSLPQTHTMAAGHPGPLHEIQSSSATWRSVKYHSTAWTSSSSSGKKRKASTSQDAGVFGSPESSLGSA
ncbi:hypothetical protein VKT23_019381 [Stygiomarasmius scandens]|uniref:Uncharacterized protein n=1 Tax=Marasmiellus scandens TaxID=2682957 RepID=A0ABR1IQT6_9AGAR